MNKYLFVIFIFITACQHHKAPENSINIDTSAIVTIPVEGMTCEGCENTIEMNVNELEGIKYVKASHLNKNVKLIFDSSKVSLNQVKDKIKETGYIVMK